MMADDEIRCWYCKTLQKESSRCIGCGARLKDYDREDYSLFPLKCNMCFKQKPLYLLQEGNSGIYHEWEESLFCRKCGKKLINEKLKEER